MENNKKNEEKQRPLQAVIAAAVCACGCGLLTAGFIISPAGQIHQSVLIGFGECMTFVGALLGIDYHYRGK